MVRALVICFGLMLSCSGCLPWMGLLYPMFGSFGTTSSGLLSGAEPLPLEGNHFRRYHASKKAFAVPQLTRALVRCADMVAAEHKDATLFIGDLSAFHGGFLPGHRSHRSGRDVDIAFFAADRIGTPIAPVPLVHFDRFGVGLSNGRLRRFDTPRNWALVEALLNDAEIEVQWIFVSAGLKALLLEWALQHNRDLEVVEKAASVLRQPGDSAPHDDHFHVRIFCPKGSVGSHCTDLQPIWPWISPAPSPPIPADEVLLRAALEDLE